MEKLVIHLVALSLLLVQSEPANAVSQEGPSISGKAVFKGAKAPKRRKIDTGADAACHKMHESEPLLSETVLVNDDGTLRNVFVYVKDGLGDKKFEAPKDPVVLKQVGCRYEPHVFGIMVGQPLKIVNGDDTMHNVHGTPAVNKEFNFSQAKKGQEDVRSFDTPEVMVPIKCDVHGWMNCYGGVLTHPFFAVTGDGGTFELKGLPAGKYTIVAWHEKYGTQEKVVELGKDSQQIEFTFGEK
jgi:plastocyanin